MQRIQFTHAQQYYGKPDGAEQTDVLKVEADSGGVYFTGTRDSAYRWGCSRTYRNMTLATALRAFMAENGQTLISFTEL